MTIEDSQDALPENLALRLRRAKSWLERAKKEEGDRDAEFIFYWIAFNSIYGKEESSGFRSKDRELYDDFFRTVLSIDPENRISEAVWKNLSDTTSRLLENQFVYRPFWKNVFSRGKDCKNWKSKFEEDERRGLSTLARGNTRGALNIIFDRLYVARNQIIHGGAAWEIGRNREQIRDGAAILALLVPRFIELMESNPHIDWGPPDYRFVDETGSIL